MRRIPVEAAVAEAVAEAAPGAAVIADLTKDPKAVAIGETVGGFSD